MRLRASSLLLLAAVSLAAVSAYGQEDDIAAPAASITLSGALESRVALPAGSESWDAGYSGVMKRPEVENELGLEAKKGSLKAVLNATVTATPTGNEVRFGENYLSWSPDAFRLDLGYKIFAWGTADGRNPTDNINPRDYGSISGQKIRKLSVFAGSAAWYPSESLAVEAAFVPVAGASVFPRDYVTELKARGLTASAAEPESSLGNSIAGGRVNYRSQAFDASISYLYDLDPFYTPVVHSDYSVELVRKRIQRFGADFKTTYGGLGLWAEGCYSLTGNSDAKDYEERISKLDCTIGLDRSFGPADAGYVNLQYAGTWVPGFDASRNSFAQSDPRYMEKNLVYYVAGVREEWLHSLILSSHWNLASETVVPSLAVSYSLPVRYDDAAAKRYGTLVLKPEIELTPSDAFHVTFGATLAYAFVKRAGRDGISLDTNDSVGVYTPQNNVFLAVKYQWNSQLGK